MEKVGVYRLSGLKRIVEQLLEDYAKGECRKEEETGDKAGC